MAQPFAQPVLGRALHRVTIQDVAIGTLLPVVWLSLYVRTLAPDLLRGDGAEFQALAVSLGLAHPTGYPNYLLIAHLFTLLPVGNYASRVNLLSAVAAALTLTLLYFGARRLGCRPFTALVGPLALGVGRMFWWHAVMAETYTLAMALIAAILLLLMHAHHSGSRRGLFGAGLLGGLGLGTHGTVLLLAPTALLYLLLTTRRPRPWVVAAGGALTGVLLTLAAFVLLDARDAPVSFYNSTVRPWVVRWGLGPDDFTTPVQRIWFLLAARQFQGAIGSQPLATLPERAGQYWQYLSEEWAPAALVLMALGLGWLLAQRSSRRDGLLLLGAGATLIAFVLNYNVYDVYVFYLPGYVPLALLVCAGAEALCTAAERLLARRQVASMRNREPSRARPSLSMSAAAVLGVLLALAVMWPALPRVGASARAGRITFLDGTDFVNYPYPVLAPDAPHRRGVQLAALVEDDALVYTDWGSVFILYYVAHIEQHRTGITVHEWFNPQNDPVVRAALIASLDASLARRPVYIHHIPPSLVDVYDFTPVGDGLLFRLRARG